MTLEIVLIGMALLWDWIEGRRREAGLEDHRSAGGRVVWTFGIALLSVGPAGLIASILGLRRGIQWTQSAVLMGTVLSIAISISAFSASIPILQDNLGHILLVMGSASFIATLFTIQESRRIWTSAHLIDAHILLVLGVLISPLPTIAFLSTLLVLSTLTWLTGILQLRKMLRFWGATDLVFAGLMAILTMGTITFLLGIIMILAASQFWTSTIAGGIWSGLFIIVAGSLTISAGYNKNNRCLRIGALVMCYIAVVMAGASGMINLIAFG